MKTWTEKFEMIRKNIKEKLNNKNKNKHTER